MSMLCRRAVAVGAFLALGAFAFPSAAQDQRIVFSTNWKAQAEHGGYYQAVAKGFYKKRGLDVQIRQGGPAIDNQQLMAARAIDMAIGSNFFYAFNLVQANAPAIAVAALFQKDPQILLTHATSPISSIAEMKGKPIMIAKSASNTYWVWLKAKYGFTDEQIRPYTFNSAPFLVDKNAIQQGYISSEPYKIKKEAGVDTKFFLLADHGYGTYGNLVIVQDAPIRHRRFRRHEGARRRRHDGCALEGVLRRARQGRGIPGDARLQARLHHAVREQEPRRRDAPQGRALSMIPKSGYRFSEKIMLEQTDRAG